MSILTVSDGSYSQSREMGAPLSVGVLPNVILYERISNDEKDTLRFMALALDDDTSSSSSSSSPDWTEDANVELAMDVVLRLRLDLRGP